MDLECRTGTNGFDPFQILMTSLVLRSVIRVGIGETDLPKGPLGVLWVVQHIRPQSRAATSLRRPCISWSETNGKLALKVERCSYGVAVPQSLGEYEMVMATPPQILNLLDPIRAGFPGA